MNKYPAFPKDITIGDKYDPAMKITLKQDAEQYFERCVEHTELHGHSRDEAIHIEKANLAYYAGHGSDETRARVEELFKCSHPVFGTVK